MRDNISKRRLGYGPLLRQGTHWRPVTRGINRHRGIILLWSASVCPTRPYKSDGGWHRVLVFSCCAVLSVSRAPGRNRRIPKIAWYRIVTRVRQLTAKCRHVIVGTREQHRPATGYAVLTVTAVYPHIY